MRLKQQRMLLHCPGCLTTVRPRLEYAGLAVRCRTCDCRFRLPDYGALHVERSDRKLAPQRN